MTTWDNLDGLEERIFRSQTKFDYTKWKNVVTEVKLMSVGWDTSYQHVVEWPTEEARDRYFDIKGGLIDEKETNWNFKDLGNNTASIQISTSVASATNFNYLSVKMGEAPVPNNNAPRNIFYYFVMGSDSKAGNTTILHLKLDSWTTYRNSIDVSALKLEQGHYAHVLTSADKYLSNPIENSLGLTTPEPGLSSLKPIVSSESFISFQKNSPRVCFATTIDFSDKNKMWLNVKNLVVDFNNGAPGVSHPSNKPAPADNWWEKHSDYPDSDEFPIDTNSPVIPVSTKVDGAVPGLRVYSLNPTDYVRFINYLRKKFPQAVKSIKSIFLLDSALIDEAAAIDFFGFSIKPVVQQGDASLISTFKLNKELFDYDTLNKDFAKLYTSQFSVIEVSNLQGSTAEISIEDISENLEIYARSSTTFPFLKLEAFINGVGGNSSKSYAVKPFNSSTAKLFQSNWESFKFDYSIPTYGVFIEAREEIGSRSQASAAKANSDNRINFINSNTVASNDSQISTATTLANYANAVNSNFYNYTTSFQKRHFDHSNKNTVLNRDHELAKDAISLNYDLLVAKYDVDIENATASIINTYDNGTASNAHSQSMSILTNQASYDNAVLSYENSYENSIRSIALSKTVTERTALSAYDGAGYNLSALWDIYEVNQEISKVSTVLNMINTGELGNLKIMTGALETLSSSVASMNPVSMLGGGVSSVMDVIMTELVEKKKTGLIVDQTNLANSDIPVSLPTEDISGYPAGSLYNGESKGAAYMMYQNDLASYASASAYSLSILNLADSQLNEITNLDASQVVTEAVVEKNFETSRDVAEYSWASTEGTLIGNKRTSEEALENSDFLNRSQALRVNLNDNRLLDENLSFDIDTSDDLLAIDDQISDTLQEAAHENLNRSFENSKFANSASLDQKTNSNKIAYQQALQAIKLGYYNDVQGSPTMYGSDSGSAWVDNWSQRGIDIRVKRCSKEVEKIASARFYRFGYHSPGTWIDQPELGLMNKFTYWKAEEIWITAEKIDETNKDIIRKIFTDGVTIWVDPEEVMNVDINNNKPRS